jgi:curved DNA-binding protein CbpA
VVTHYQVLGVRPDATQDEIRRAYHALARRHHPDTRPGADPSESREAGRAMAAVNDAWEVLGDPARRRAYDNAGPPGERRGHADPDADGWAPSHQGFDGRGDADWDDAEWEDDGRPPLVTGGFGLVVMVPVALVLAAAGIFFFSTMTQSEVLRNLAIVLIPVAGFGFVAAPLLVMVRSRSRG